MIQIFLQINLQHGEKEILQLWGKFTFLASSCVVPKMYIKEIESCFYRFIWNGKPDKVKRLTFIKIFNRFTIVYIHFKN
jgi:hypothetical protein